MLKKMTDTRNMNKGVKRTLTDIELVKTLMYGIETIPLHFLYKIKLKALDISYLTDSYEVTRLNRQTIGLEYRRK